MSLKELKELAEKATPGPWGHMTDHGQVGDVSTADGQPLLQVQARISDGSNRAHSVERRNRDAAYIAACSPDRILRLISALEKAEWLLDAADDALNSNGYDCDGPLRSGIAAALSEIRGMKEGN